MKKIDAATCLADAIRNTENQFIKHSPHEKQLRFLAIARHPDVREAFFGGAGGGGKSDALLMLALQSDWLADPDYSALILRKTYVDLNQPEGILNRAQDWLFGKSGVVWQAQHNRFVFASGSVIQFAHCHGPNDHLKFRGGKFNLVLWDELTDFPENQYTFLFSRQRRPEGSKLPLLTAAASNPGGKGHMWVKERFIDSKQAGRYFQPANYTDNPYLDRDAYGATLDQLLPVERARIKFGDWTATDTDTLYNLSWIRFYDELPSEPLIRVRAWDTAASSGKGDYSVGIKMARVGDEYYVEDMIRGQWGPAELDSIQLETAVQDGQDVRIVLEEEPGSAGKRVVEMTKQRLCDYYVMSERNTGDKYVRAIPAARAAANGRFYVKRGAKWIKPFIDEVTSFTGDDKIDKNDDIVDATSLAYNHMARMVVLQ